jgi:hypothetical protein
LQVFEGHLKVPCCASCISNDKNTPRSLLETRSREYLQQGQESLEKKEELDATVAAATAPVPVFETDGSGKVIDEFRAGLAASSTVAAGNPALESSLLMLPAVSLPATSSAAASPAAMMRVSTRMPSAKRCRRLLMLSILYITTASLAPVKL